MSFSVYDNNYTRMSNPTLLTDVNYSTLNIVPKDEAESMGMEFHDEQQYFSNLPNSHNASVEDLNKRILPNSLSEGEVCSPRLNSDLDKKL